MTCQARDRNGEEPDTIATLLTALADPTRLRILALLRGKDLCVCEIQQSLDATQPTVSRHLGHLRHAGLVTTRKEGLWVHYELAADVPETLRSVVQSLEQSVSRSPQGMKDRARLAARPRCCEPE